MTIITRLQAARNNADVCQQTHHLLTSLFQGTLAPEDIFSADYQQCTDGQLLDYAGFVRHLQHVRSQIQRIDFCVQQACCHDNLLADRHIVTVTRPDGAEAEIEVYMFAQLRDSKISRIDEITRVMRGSHADQSLASATE